MTKSVNAAGLAVASGVGLTALYTFLISGADAITKLFAATYAAPQLFALSGGLVAVFCLLAHRRGRHSHHGLRTSCPRAMIVRVVATVLGTIAFFYAFRLLPFADVFLFIAIIPILAAFLSGPVLGERVGAQAWGALALGVVGVACLFPGGMQSISIGHLVALTAVLMGTISMVASRYIGQRDQSLLLQVFYPNLALMVVMACALPFVFAPMAVVDVVWAVLYAVLLFAARWVLVAALRALPAYVVTPLMNLQFLWMVALGIVVFGERPDAMVYVGAAITMIAGAWLVWDQARPKPMGQLVPAE